MPPLVSLVLAMLLDRDTEFPWQAIIVGSNGLRNALGCFVSPSLGLTAVFNTPCLRLAASHGVV